MGKSVVLLLLFLSPLAFVALPSLAQPPDECSTCDTPGAPLTLGKGCGNTTVTGGSVFISNSTQPLYLRGQRTDNWAWFARTSSTGSGATYTIVFDSESITGNDPASPTHSSGTTTLNRDGNYLVCYRITTDSGAGLARDAFVNPSNTGVPTGAKPCRTRESSQVATGTMLNTCCVLLEQNSGDTFTVDYSQSGTSGCCGSSYSRCTLFVQLLAGTGE